MVTQETLFYFLSIVIIFAATCVLMLPNPIYAALSLAGTMIALGFMYYLLGAYFIAGVQFIVYAGAVMVLFVMVLMLFDLKKETDSFSRRAIPTIVKLVCGGLIALCLFFVFRESGEPHLMPTAVSAPADQVQSVKQLAFKLFYDYVLVFEVLGILLLIIAIGVVAVARTKGGTHARH